MKLREILWSIDWVAAAAMVLLIATGLAMLFSAGYQAGVLGSLFFRQLLFAAVGAAIFGLMVRLPYHALRRYVATLYGVGLLGLLAVAVFGQVIRGTVSRLEIVGVQLQPSEFMKAILVLSLAWLLARYVRMGWRVLLTSAVVTGVPTALVLLEPDVGIAALMIGVWFAYLLFWGMPWRYIIALLLIGTALCGVAWQTILADYQRQRLITFLDPTADPLGSGYNVVQSIVALGSGQLVGRGLGHGPQSQLKFLPEQHTDFILASIGEELGFIGVAAVLLLYAVLLWRILAVARLTRDPFGQLLAVGTFLTLLASLTVSAGMNMGVLPVTGIPLPLVSYGGSSLVATTFLLGVVQSVRVYSKWVQAPPGEIEGIN